jgi:protein TonB
LLSTVGLNYRSVPVKLIAAGLVLGLHLAVLGLVLAAPSVQPQIQPSDPADVQMVEIAMEPAQAPGPAPEPLLPAAAAAEKAPQTEPQPEEPAEAPPETTHELPPEPVVDTAAVEPEKPPVVASRAEEKVVQAPPKPHKHGRKPEHNARPKPVPKSAEPAPRPTLAKTNVEPPPGTVASTAAASSSAPSRLAQSDQPRLIGRVDYLGQRPVPVYPRLSERRGEQGRVIVRVLISAQGSVVSVSVRRSSGYSRLDGAALDAARAAHFKPYTENGIAYAAMADIPFDFVL